MAITIYLYWSNRFVWNKIFTFQSIINKDEWVIFAMLNLSNSYSCYWLQLSLINNLIQYTERIHFPLEFNSSFYDDEQRNELKQNSQSSISTYVIVFQWFARSSDVRLRCVSLVDSSVSLISILNFNKLINVFASRIVPLKNVSSFTFRPDLRLSGIDYITCANFDFSSCHSGF